MTITTPQENQRTDDLRTDDLAMATFLTVSGHKHRCLEVKDRRSVVWVFDGTTDLYEAVSCYNRVAARVEPLEYTQTLRAVRDELYQFKNANGL